VEPGLNVPAELEQVVLRCLSKSPADRYATMDDLAVAMQEALGLDVLPGSSHSASPATPSSPRWRPVTTESTDTLAATRIEQRPSAVPIPSEAPSKPSRFSVVLGVSALLTVAVAFTWHRYADRSVASRTGSDASSAVASETSVPASAGGVERVEVWVRSTPSGARVARGEEDLGNTPARLLLAPEDRWVLTVSARGYTERTVRVSQAQREVNVVLESNENHAGSATVSHDDPGGGERTDSDGPRNPGTRGRPTPRAMTPSAMLSDATEVTPPRRLTDNRDPWSSAP
jgi:serine/threonine-protein kinase